MADPCLAQAQSFPTKKRWAINSIEIKAIARFMSEMIAAETREAEPATRKTPFQPLRSTGHRKRELNSSPLSRL